MHRIKNLLWLMKALLGMLLTFLLFFFFASLQNAVAQELAGYREAVVFVASIVGISFAGFLSGAGKKCQGWLHGGLAGLGYMLIWCLMHLWSYGVSLAVLPRLSFLVGVAFLCGAIGGVAGINLRKYKEKGHGSFFT